MERKVSYFEYGEKELTYLKQKDKRLAAVIGQLGWLPREVIPDLFTALVNAIVGQQITIKAFATIWERLLTHFGTITPEAMSQASPETLRSFGLSYRKVAYIQSAAQKIVSGELQLDSLQSLSDEEVCARLVSLEGVGQWTAEMLMLHALQRPDVLSFGDVGILRGMRMVYHHRQITRELFEKYRRRYAPYGSVASIYLWAVSSGAVAGMKDYAPSRATARRQITKE